MASIALRKLSKTFGARAVIPGIDLDVADGELVVFVGPSGCGKSTLLRLIAGLEGVTSGQLLIGGEDVTQLPPAQRGLSMVFQSYALYPHMSVRDNIAFPLKMAGVDKAERERKVGEAARMLNLEGVLDRKPRTLSGGQRQRVAIGRAIVREPRAFLFDEPLSNLDAALRVNMRMEIAALHRRLGATMIYVTHDQVEAMTLADRIVVLNHGEIEQVGTPLELYHTPATRFVGGFIGSPSMNFLEGGRASSYGAVSVGIRPEHLTLSRTEGTFRGRVQLVEHLAVETFVHVQIDERDSFTVRVQGECDVRPDEEVWLTPDARSVHRFDSEGRALPPRNQG